MKKSVGLFLLMGLVFLVTFAQADGMKVESFTLDCKVDKSTGESVFDAPVTVTVALPIGYDEELDARYAVCYVLDGASYVGESDSAGLNAMYAQYPETMPKIIYIGVNHPEGTYRSGVLGAPFDTYFFLVDQNRAILDQRLKGQGDYFFNWIADTLKPYIDEHYRTLTDAENTGIVGYSSGASGAMIAAILRSDMFSRVGAFSPATWLWDDWFYGAISNSGYHYNYVDESGAERDYTVSVEGISHLFVYQGGNDGSAGNPDWAQHDVENLYNLMLEKGAGSIGHRFLWYQEGTHSAEPWKMLNNNCMRFLFPEYVENEFFRQ